jgi:formylmethanofuran dehydrogenase subunit A
MLGILGGRVYDPANGIDGEVRDLWVKDGRVVAAGEVDRETAETVDAAGLVVMPGGVDVHSHCVGAKVNAGRKLRPEDHRGHERARVAARCARARGGPCPPPTSPATSTRRWATPR